MCKSATMHPRCMLHCAHFRIETGASALAELHCAKATAPSSKAHDMTACAIVTAKGYAALSAQPCRCAQCNMQWLWQGVALRCPTRQPDRTHQRCHSGSAWVKKLHCAHMSIHLHSRPSAFRPLTACDSRDLISRPRLSRLELINSRLLRYTQHAGTHLGRGELATK